MDASRGGRGHGARGHGRGHGRGRGRGPGFGEHVFEENFEEGHVHDTDSDSGGDDVPPPPPPPNMAQMMLMQTQILQQLAANVANQNQGQPPQSGFAEFMRAKPPTFEGSADPLDADDWLKDIRKTLNLANCTAENLVKFAAHQLKGVAADWWENYCEAHEDAQTITWNEFAEAFRTAHIPAGIMELKRDEFQALTQGKMTVSEYLSRFTQLARYGRADIPTEADKTAKFLKGLNPGLKDRLVSHDFLTFQALVNKAILQENSRRELEEHRKRRAPQNHHGAGSSRQKIGHHPGYRAQYVKPSRPNNTYQPNAYKTPRAEVGGNHANIAGKACFSCAQEGHFAVACPNKNTGPTPVKFNLGSAVKTPAAGRGRGILNTPGGAPHASGRGRVNHVTIELAQESPDVVLGMFPINSYYGSVLFDTGASHSFISRSFAEKHHFRTEGLNLQMVVQSPGGYSKDYAEVS